MKEYLENILPVIAGFYEVKLYNHRLQYWEHRTNYVYFGNDNRLHIYTPTPYCIGKAVSSYKNDDFAKKIEGLKGYLNPKDSISDVLFSCSLGIYLNTIVCINIDTTGNNRIRINIVTENELQITLIKTETSIRWDKLKIAECINFS